jgi:lipopolysaccharide/colanic/teichoic acid biosynthesis glycosyltransferase
LRGPVESGHDFDVDVDVVPRLFDVLGPAPRTYGLGALPVLSVASPRRSPVGLALKRGFDVVVSALTLAALAPLMALIAGAIMLESGRPVLFMQRRLGRDGAPFDVVKFRTMASGPAGSGQELLLAAAGPDAIAATVASIKAGSALYVTRVGRLLRKTSLDELPQLWNVLAGQMSIVGPRPLRDFEVAALEDWQQLRQRMRPGITGLWQVLGRGEVEWDERMLLDYSYVRHWSLGADLRILAGTVPAVMTQRGAL